MTQDAIPTESIVQRLQASPTGRALLRDGSHVLAMYTSDPALTILRPQDGLTVAWTDGVNAYHSTYYAALGVWKKSAQT